MTIDPTRLEQLDSYVDEVMAERQLASCQYALALDGRVVAARTVGLATPTSRYWMASSTKVLSVAVVWQLIGEGLLDPRQRITHWWPEFSSHGKDAITLEQVLGHSAGLTGATVSSAAWSDRDRRRSELEGWVVEWEPGTRFEYHGLSAYWILAELIELVTGQPYRQAVRARLLDPLDLPRIQLGVPVDEQDDVLRLVACGQPATAEEVAESLGDPRLAVVIAPMIDGATTDPQDDPVLGAILSPEGLAAGIPGGGGVGDASSMALLYQALLRNERDLWRPETLLEVRSTIVNEHPTFLGVPAMRGLGLEVSGGGPMEQRRHRIGSGFTSPATFGHSGAGGQMAWADPESGLSFAFFTNGWDRNVVRMVERQRALDERVVACVDLGS